MPGPTDTTPLDRPAGDSRSRPAGKLAEQVALRIEADVRSAGWPVGSNLGSETDLLARYGVSRAVLREAVSLTEYLGVARMRRGPSGGLIVTEPDQSAVVTAVIVFLTYRQVRLEDILEVRLPLERAAARLAAERRTPADMELLRQRLEHEQQAARTDHWAFHEVVAASSGNPVLALLVAILGRITNQYQGTNSLSRKRRQEALGSITSAHRAVVEAVLAGDANLAADRMEVHLQAVADFFASRSRLDRTITLGEGEPGDGEKLGSSVARRILADVVAAGWPVGESLGSEKDLIERYGVSRAVLREANRLLEYHGVLRTQRGVGGGIFVSAPDELATTNALAVYLDSRAVTPKELFAVREAIELASVATAATKLDKYAIGVLVEALVEEMSAPASEIGESSHALHLRIAELTGNPAVSLILHALTRLTEQRTYNPDEGFPMTYEEAAASVGRAHAAIVKAIAAGDAEAAVRRMQRHLRAVPELLR